MGVFKTRKSDYQSTKSRKSPYTLSREAYDRFDGSILNLGNVDQPSVSREALAAVFDLAGFTKFSGQIDPQLCVPFFMSKFLEWLFEKVKEVSTVRRRGNRVYLAAPLPFFAKFMGDGVLFLWDTKGLTNDQVVDIAMSMSQITRRYASDMYPNAKYHFVDPPSALRVGIARGQVLSVGDGDDFVGPCINMAARLQKLAASVKTCVSTRGINVFATSHRNHLVVKSVSIRGVGERELVCLWTDEFAGLSDEERTLFYEPHEPEE